MTPDETDLAERIRHLEDRVAALERQNQPAADRFMDEELKTYGFR